MVLGVELGYDYIVGGGGRVLAGASKTSSAQLRKLLKAAHTGPDEKRTSIKYENRRPRPRDARGTRT